MKSISIEIKARFDQLTAGFKGASDSVRRSLDDMSASISTAGSRLSAMSTSISTAGSLARTAGIGLTAGLTVGIMAMGAGAIKASAQIETLQTAFVPLLESAAAARDRIGELQQFANLTPFALPEVAQASRVLQVLTKGALATGDSLRLIGDVASGTNQPFQDVAMWVGRLYDGLKSGAPVGEATMRLMEMGAMSAETKLKLEQLQKEGVKGSAIWAIAQRDFASFAGGMALQADTMAGKWSTLQDSARTALGAIGNAIAPAAKVLLDFLTKVTDALAVLAGWFESLPGFVQGTVVALAALAAAMGPLLLAFGTLAGALTSVIAAWPMIAAGATAFGAALVPLLPALAAVAAGVAAVALAVDVVKNGWTATGREEARQARESARIEEETVKKVAAIRKKAADDRAQVAAEELAKKSAAEQKAQDEREKAAKASAKRIADFRMEREQEVIDYANAAEQQRANHEMALRQKLADAQWRAQIAAEQKADDEDRRRREEAARLRQQEYDQALEKTRERLAKEDEEDAERAEKTKARWALVGQVVGQSFTAPLQSSFARFFESGKMGFARLWQDMKDGFKAALAQMAAQMATSGIFRILGMIVGGPVGLSISSLAMPSFAVGTPYVPRDMVANIHEGERILTKSENRAFSAGEMGGASAGRGRLIDFDQEVYAALERNGSVTVRINASQVRNFALGGV